MSGRKETVLDLAKFFDKGVQVKLTGGRQGVNALISTKNLFLTSRHGRGRSQWSKGDILWTERGGEVTYHGPGQLVMYPIINLRYHKMDLHWYLRSLEEVIIRVLNSTFSMKASRIDGLTGVWAGNQKLAAVGIRVSRSIAYHGLALNVTMDLTPFRHIVPCGIQDRAVGSLGGLLGGSSNGATDVDSDLMDVACESLLKEFFDIFQLSFEHRLISELEVPKETH